MVGGPATPWQHFGCILGPLPPRRGGDHGDDSDVCGDYDDLVFNATSSKPPTFMNCFLAVSDDLICSPERSCDCIPPPSHEDSTMVGCNVDFPAVPILRPYFRKTDRQRGRCGFIDIAGGESGDAGGGIATTGSRTAPFQVNTLKLAAFNVITETVTTVCDGVPPGSLGLSFVSLSGWPTTCCPAR